MSIFVKAVNATKPKSEQAKQIALLYAIILVIMAVAQLFTYDTFIELIATFNLPLSESMVYLVAPLIIVGEVFALPFLLRMRLSPAFRVVSMVCSWLVPVVWLLISLWLVTTNQVVETVGFVGTIGQLVPGWWAVLISSALIVMSAWATWGLWPLDRSKK